VQPPAALVTPAPPKMSLALLSQAAEWLYQVNPTLCKVPPRANDEEYCYMGPDGGPIDALFCKDISYAMATCVGSWLLSPQHHIIEGIVVTIGALLLLQWVTPKLFGSMDPLSLKVQHPAGSRLASLFCFGMVFIYKWFGYPRRIFYLVMPCNMQWVLSFVQCWIIPQSWTRTQYTVLQMRLTYIMSVVIAIVMPETDDCEMPGEYAFYWLNHVLLLWLPYAYINNGSVSCFPPSTSNKDTQTPTAPTTAPTTTTFNLRWWLFSCAIFALFYFIPVTLLAIYSGLNLNFMLHPPHDHLFLRGQWYRLVTILLLMVVFGISRLLVLSVEKASLAGNNKNSNLAETNKSKQS
jgi:TMEM164 family